MIYCKTIEEFKMYSQIQVKLNGRVLIDERKDSKCILCTKTFKPLVTYILGDK